VIRLMYERAICWAVGRSCCLCLSLSGEHSLVLCFAVGGPVSRGGGQVDPHISLRNLTPAVMALSVAHGSYFYHLSSSTGDWCTQRNGLVPFLLVACSIAGRPYGLIPYLLHLPAII
jgi:hypothetical protein